MPFSFLTTGDGLLPLIILVHALYCNEPCARIGHYTFYLWRYLLQSPIRRHLLLAPVYSAGFLYFSRL